MKVLPGVLVAVVLMLGGCSIGESKPAGDGEPRAGEPGEAQAIRAWSIALNKEDYEKAASYFAEDAIVEQAGEVRLRDRDAAVALNQSLPCKADVTDVEDEGKTVLAAFRLRGGPAGGCDGGTARVRFRFEDGKFSEWRQLTAPPPAEGDIA